MRDIWEIRERKDKLANIYVAGTGVAIALCVRPDDAVDIVRQHNSRDDLLDSVEALLQVYIVLKRSAGQGGDTVWVKQGSAGRQLYQLVQDIERALLRAGRKINLTRA